METIESMQARLTLLKNIKPQSICSTSEGCLIDLTAFRIAELEADIEDRLDSEKCKKL